MNTAVKKIRWLKLSSSMRNWYMVSLIFLIPAGSIAEPLCRCTQQTVEGTYAWTFDNTLIMTFEDGTKMSGAIMNR